MEVSPAYLFLIPGSIGKVGDSGHLNYTYVEFSLSWRIPFEIDLTILEISHIKNMKLVKSQLLQLKMKILAV